MTKKESRRFDVAVVGATGAVGEVMLSVLEERHFPVGRVYPLASHRSAGKKLQFQGKDLLVQNLEDFDFSKVQVALFSPGASISKIFAPRAAQAGCVVIDNTSQFRYDDDIPLIVPEVNASSVLGYKNRGIIANPNCSTIQLMVALKPIYDSVGIVRLNVCTYQAVSGTGKLAIDELTEQSADVLNNLRIHPSVYSKQIAFNVLPHCDVFMNNGYTKEEMKIVWETRKILDDNSIMVNPTAVRVPVVYGHSEAVHIETERKITAESACRLLASSPGIEVMDCREDGGYPTAATESAGTDAVYVGRIREDISHPLGLNMWVVADNLRKGAALNSVQIAEILVKNFL